MYKGHEFVKDDDCRQFYVFTDAQKTINGCNITKGVFKINQYNRGITLHQMIPFWDIDEILFGSTPKFVSYDIYNNFYLYKWHYAFPAKLFFNSKIKIIERNYYTDMIELEEPILICNLPVWKNEEKVRRAVNFCGLHLCYVRNPPEDLVLQVLEKCPNAICFVKNQTLNMWEKIINKFQTMNINLYKYARLDDPQIYKRGIVIQIERMLQVIDSEDKEAKNLVNKTCCESIKTILLQTPEKYKKEIFDDLPDNLKKIIEGDLIKETIIPMTGKQFIANLGTKITDQYIVLLDSLCKTSGQRVSCGYNKYETCVIPTEMSGFWIMKPEDCLKMINGFSHSEEVRGSPFHTKNMIYYFSYFSFVSVPLDAKVYLSTDTRFKNVYITDSLFIHQIRPIQQFFMFNSKKFRLDCCSKYGYLLKFIKNPTVEIMIKACINCPRAILLLESSAPKECVNAIIENATDASYLILHPNPSKVITESFRYKYKEDINKYLPVL
jgi:hypothetical protein